MARNAFLGMLALVVFIAQSAGGQQFISIGSLAVARSSGPTATLMSNGQVLIAGGWEMASGYATNAAELYDPTTGRFTPTGAMADARASHVATALPDGRVLVAGGSAQTASAYVNVMSVEIYDPQSGTFQVVGRTIMPHSGAAVLLPSGKVLFWGGSFETPEIYDRTSNTSRTLTPSSFVSGSAITPLADGRVLLTGGLGGNGVPTRLAKFFDPSAETILEAPPAGGFANHFAVELHSREVLLGGGISNVFSGITNCASAVSLYDPATGISRATTNLASPLCAPVAARLSDGKVLVSGGAQAEIYDPLTETFTAVDDRLSGSSRTMTRLTSGEVLILASSQAELFVPALAPSCVPVPLTCPVTVAGALGQCKLDVGTPPRRLPQPGNQYLISATAGDTLHLRALSTSGDFLMLSILEDRPHGGQYVSGVNSLDFAVPNTQSYVVQVVQIGIPTAYTLAITGCTIPPECQIAAPLAQSIMDPFTGGVVTCGDEGDPQPTMGATMRLMWSPVPGADRYFYELDSVTSFFPFYTFTLLTGTTSASTVTVTVPFQPPPYSSFNFYWRVRASRIGTDPSVPCQWSQPCDFAMNIPARRRSARH